MHPIDKVAAVVHASLPSGPVPVLFPRLARKG